MLERFFQLEKHHTSIRQELIAGTTTFLTMAYIIFVNPNILGAAGMDKGALITVTALVSFLGTFIMGVWAKAPLAMAPGLGLNAFFTYSLVIGQHITWQTALGVVFVSGVLFLILTFFGIRERIVQAIPLSLRLSIPAGIGLFITFIGFQNMGLIIQSEATLVTLGTFNLPLALGLLGLLLITILEVRKVKGSILIGILATTGAGLILGEITLPGQLVSYPPSIAPLAGQLNISEALRFGLLGAIFSFMFVDLFDSVGTMIACSYEAGLVNKDGSVDKIGRMLESDALATVIGALMGTSTTTTYIESASGIEDGGRTGLTAVTTAFLFLFALLFTPLISVVPEYATAPALVVVGIFMFKNIGKMEFNHFEEIVPAFLTIILMPLTYSISLGLTFGFISYLFMMMAAGRTNEISSLLWIIGAFSMLNLLITAMPGLL